MSSEAAATGDRLCPFEQLRHGREVLRRKSPTLTRLADCLTPGFCTAVGYLDRCCPPWASWAYRF